MKDTMDVQNQRIITKDGQIARLMDQVANLKSENAELQEAFNYVATDFKNLQAEILEEMRVENTQAEMIFNLQRHTNEISR